MDGDIYCDLRDSICETSLRGADISIGHLVETGISAEQVAKIRRYSKVLFTHSEV